MMSPAERHGEFVAHLASERPGLRKSEMMGIRGLTPANQAGLRADKFEVRLVAMAPRLADRQHAFVDASPETRPRSWSDLGSDSVRAIDAVQFDFEGIGSRPRVHARASNGTSLAPAVPAFGRSECLVQHC